MAERKKFIEVEIPLLNKEIRVLGTAKELEKKTIKLDLTRKLRGKSIIITFQIFNKDEKLIAIPKKSEIIKSYFKKIIRKRTDNVEDSFDVHFIDIKAKIKPFLITRKRVSRAVRKNLRKTAREFLTEYTKQINYNDFCYEILDGTLQKNMLPKLKKIYPLAFCDIRVFETKELEKIDLNSILSTEIKENVEEESDNQTDEEYNKEEELNEEIEMEKNENESNEEKKEEPEEKKPKEPKITKKITKKSTKK